MSDLWPSALTQLKLRDDVFIDLDVHNAQFTRNRVHVNPESGSRKVYGCKPMANKPLIGIRRIVATNVQALLDRDFPGPGGQIGRFLKKHPKVGLSKMQRAVNEGGINMSTVDQIAAAFKVQPYQLFIHKLNVDSPQIAIAPKYVANVQRMAKELEGVEE